MQGGGSAQPAQPAQQPLDLLNLGGQASAPQQQPSASQPAATANVMDLLGGASSQPPAQPAPSAYAPPAMGQQPANLLGGLNLGGTAAAQPAPAQPAQASGFSFM